MDKVAALGRTQLFGALDGTALGELAEVSHRRQLGRGEILFLAGEEAAGLFVVCAGEIRAYRVNAQGREQTIHVERAGATLAEVPLFDDGPYPATAVAESPATVLFLAKADFRQFLLRHPAVALVALRLMAKRLRGHAELVDSLALQQVGQRVARFLLAEAAGRDFAELTASNEELAKRLGTVREVVSRTLSRLEADGLIGQQPAHAGQPRRILLCDPARLATYGDSA